MGSKEEYEAQQRARGKRPGQDHRTQAEQHRDKGDEMAERAISAVERIAAVRCWQEHGPPSGNGKGVPK